MGSQSGRTTSRNKPPTLFGVLGDTYLFVALVERAADGGESNWMRRTLRVDPTAGDDDELVVTVTEGRRTDDESARVAAPDRFTASVPIDADTERPRLSTLRRALQRWHRSAVRMD